MALVIDLCATPRVFRRRKSAGIHDTAQCFDLACRFRFVFLEAGGRRGSCPCDDCIHKLRPPAHINPHANPAALLQKTDRHRRGRAQRVQADLRLLADADAEKIRVMVQEQRLVCIRRKLRFGNAPRNLVLLRLCEKSDEGFISAGGRFGVKSEFWRCGLKKGCGTTGMSFSRHPARECARRACSCKRM